MGLTKGSTGVMARRRAPQQRNDDDRPDVPSPLHRPVMLAETLGLLDPRPGDRVMDLTVGTAGHALSLAGSVGPQGLLVAMDADPSALAVAEGRLTESAPCPVRMVHGRFSAAIELTAPQRFDVVLADLGVGTHQLSDPARGLAFDSEARMDMRFDPSRPGPSAWDVVNRMDEGELADLFYQLGGERMSRPIASAICRRRSSAPIDTTADLCQLVKRVAARRTPRGKTWRIHPATRALMALRIFVNGEMEELEALLEALPQLLAPGGRAAILSYHSLEARLVKHTWRRQAAEGTLEVLTKRAVKPSPEEIADNPGARSAQLRAVRKT